LKNPDPGKDPFGSPDSKHPGLGNDPYLPGMNDGPLTVDFLNAIVPDNPMTDVPPGVEQPTPNTGDNGDTNPTGRPAPAPEQRHDPAPIAVAPPAGQTATPPANAPQSPASDSGGRAPQRTNDNRAPDSSPQRSGGGARTAESTSQPDTAPAPEQRTASEDVQPSTQPVAETGDDRHGTGPRTESAPSPPPVAESGDDRHGTGPRDESGPPQGTEDTGHTAPGRDAEQSDGRDEDVSQNDDRSEDDAKGRSGDGRQPDEGDNDGSGDGQRSDATREGSEGGKDRSGEEEGDGSGRENGEDGERADEGAGSVHRDAPDGEAGPERNASPAPEGTPVPARSTDTDAPPAPPAAGPERAADIGS
ncbi:hypothetical protein ACFWTE_30005, partial [Nocardiopsis sp. NPDC058631]|uniref:hypothetical protein n=1 Tax=Nocardiopsis sp. NPDC058631 TaxID=3346566 RepID=UPI00365D0DF2